MDDLVATTALGGSEPRIDTVAGVTCTERPDVALASVAARMGQEKAAAKKLAKLIGAPAPDVGRFTEAEISAFWSGPDQWMVEAPFGTHEDLAAQTKQIMTEAASVTEQTDAWARFDLDGNDVLSVMELLCALDLRTMDHGAAARTPIHHLGCFVLRRGPEAFSIYGPRASAESVHHAIVTAMRSAL